MLTGKPSRGFTLVELLVGITILAVLVALGAPAMGTYLQNSKLASATAIYFNAIQTARTEAIRRNIRTEFVLTDTPLSVADIANNLTPGAGGRNWVVRAASGPTYRPAIEAKAGAEGDGSAVGAAIRVLASASAIPFNGFGGTADAGAYSINITNPGAGDCAASGGPIRCRRITVSPGGQIAACDPAASASAGDNRAC